MAVDGDASHLVDQSKGGIIAESEDPRQLALAAENLAALDHIQLAQLGENAQKYYLRHLSMRVGVSKFSEIFGRFV
jgi:hypothetical protein